MTGLQRAQKSTLHLSLSPCSGSRLQLASSTRHWCLHIEQPQAQHPPTYTPLSQSKSPQEVWYLLVSDALWCHYREAQNHFPEHFHSPFLAGGMIFPPPSGMLNPWQFLSNKKTSLSFRNFSLFPLTSHCLARICSEQCLEMCITSMCILCLYNVSLIVFLNCKSLWLKASAKLITINVKYKCTVQCKCRKISHTKLKLKLWLAGKYPTPAVWGWDHVHQKRWWP